jgi:hypothetical protein
MTIMMTIGGGGVHRTHNWRKGAPSGDDDNRDNGDSAVFVPDRSIGTVEDEMIHLVLTITLS